jgi:hypothetical protein
VKYLRQTEFDKPSFYRRFEGKFASLKKFQRHPVQIPSDPIPSMFPGHFLWGQGCDLQFPYQNGDRCVLVLYDSYRLERSQSKKEEKSQRVVYGQVQRREPNTAFIRWVWLRHFVPIPGKHYRNQARETDRESD